MIGFCRFISSLKRVQTATIGSSPLIISGRIAVFSPVEPIFLFGKQIPFP